MTTTSHYDTDALFGDLTLPLTCVRRVTGVEGDRSGVTLRCETVVLQRRMRDRYGTALEVAEEVGRGPEATIRLDAVTPHVLRMRFAPGSTVPAGATPMLAGPVPEVAAVVASDARTVTLDTGELHVTVQRDPYRLEITGADGTPLVRTIPAAVYQHPPTGESHLNGSDLSDAWPWFFRELAPLGWIEDPVSGAMQLFDTAFLDAREHFYGLGERFMGLDRRGQAVTLWQANAAGETWPLSYKNVPFFLSSAGYGHFVNSSRPITYHLGDRSSVHWSYHVQDAALDTFVVGGPAFTDIIPRYTALTGEPPMPPLWTFGLWMSRMSYDAQDQVEEIARRLREERVPCDVLHIDTDWFAEPWVNDLEFSPERFPDPDAMLAKLRDDGFRVSLWQLPYISVRSQLYDEGRALDAFALDAEGEPWLIDGFFGSAAVIDFSNPAAASWYAQKVGALLQRGVAAIKTDFGEGAPPGARYHGGDGLTMHNLYPLLYNAAIFAETERVHGEGVVWARSGYAGSQRYPVWWGGDPAARWEDLATLLAGGLSLGLCGFPFWSQDIGGFAGTPDPKLYRRWAQVGLFMTHPRAHGPIAREPWAFGEEALDDFRRWATLRYRLLPYLWSESHACVARSAPVMRPLVLDFQDDPNVARIDDQFLFGRWIMVAPVLSPQDRRPVYFPAGRWTDWRTGEIIQGPVWRDLEVPEDVLPLFLRDGAIVPLAAPVQHTGELDWSHLTLDVVPGPQSRFVLRPGDGPATELTAEATADGDVRVGLDGERAFTVRLHGIPGDSDVWLDDAPAEGAHDGLAFVVEAPSGTRALLTRRRRSAPTDDAPNRERA